MNKVKEYHIQSPTRTVFVLSLKLMCTPIGAPFSEGGMMVSMLYLDNAVNDRVFNYFALEIKIKYY